jgi:hypothetical protein
VHFQRATQHCSAAWLSPSPNAPPGEPCRPGNQMQLPRRWSMRPAAPLPPPKPVRGTCCPPCCTGRRTPRQVRCPHTCEAAHRVCGRLEKHSKQGRRRGCTSPSRQGVCRRLAPLSRARHASCTVRGTAGVIAHHSSLCCSSALTDSSPFPACAHGPPLPPVLTPRPYVSDLSCTPGPGSGVVTYCSQFAARTAPPFAVRFASQVWLGAGGSTTGHSCHNLL